MTCLETWRWSRLTWTMFSFNRKLGLSFRRCMLTLETHRHGNISYQDPEALVWKIKCIYSETKDRYWQDIAWLWQGSKEQRGSNTKNLSKLRLFLELASYQSRFIRGFTDISTGLDRATSSQIKFCSVEEMNASSSYWKRSWRMNLPWILKIFTCWLMSRQLHRV